MEGALGWLDAEHIKHVHSFHQSRFVCFLFAVSNVALLYIFAFNAGIFFTFSFLNLHTQSFNFTNASVFKSTKRRKVRKVSSINAVEEGASLITGSVQIVIVFEINSGRNVYYL